MVHEIILRRQNPLKRSLLKMNSGLGPALANIPESMLPTRADDLLEQIQPWLRRAQLRMEC